MADKRPAHWSERAHRDFWNRDDRMSDFLIHAVRVREGLEVSFNELEHRLRDLVAEHAVDWKTLSRYLSHNPTRPQRAYPITGLCVVLARLALNRGTNCPAPRQSVEWLIRIGAEGEALLELDLQLADAARGLGIREVEAKATSRSLRAPAGHAGVESVPHHAGTTSRPSVTQPASVRRRFAKHPPVKIRDLRKFLDAVPSPKLSDDPDRPEFPLNAPRYPATPALPIPGRNYALVVKDESSNPTASHKDRWALEKLLRYRDEIKKAIDRYDASGIPIKLRSLSMISSGGAAFALQSLLRLYNLPPLRVIMDKKRTDPGIVRRLRSVGALVRLHNLDDDLLTAKDVLLLTHNEGGLEITTRDFTVPFHECFYDWLVCEVLLLRPTHVFMPFGTGDLFANFLEVIAQEHRAGKRDRRLMGMTLDELTGIHLLGATTDDPQSVMDKLYAAYRPTLQAVEERARQLVEQGILGKKSRIYYVTNGDAIAARETARDWGICTEYSGIAGLALLDLLEPQLNLNKDDRVVVVNTGLLHTID